MENFLQFYERKQIRKVLKTDLTKKGDQSIIDWYGQVTKGIWGMSRRREAMKDVAGCDKPGAGVEQPIIPGSPNGETQYDWATRSYYPWLNV